MKMLEQLAASSKDFVIDLLGALILLVVGLKLISMLTKFLKKEHKFSKLDASAKGFIVSLINIGLKILLFVTCATVLGVPTTSLVTIIGSCALAVGLALQGGLSNLAGGLMILIFKPFKVGDYINTHNDEGKVKSINIFYTTLTTLDNKEVMLPNGGLSNAPIINYTVNGIRRVDLEFSVSYNSDIKKVKKTILEVVEKNKLVLQEEEKTIRLKTHGDSSLVFVTRVWTKTENFFDVEFDLKEEVKEAFDKEHIEIPYPQLDVHMNK